MTTLRTLFITAVLLAIVFLTACGNDGSRFADDAVKTSEVAKLGAKMNSRQRLTSQEFESLKNIYKEFPNAEPVRNEYEKALGQRKDWAELAEFYKNDPDKTDEEARKKLAVAYFQAGNYSDAEKIAREFDPKQEASMRKALLGSLYHLGKYDEAEKLFEDHWTAIVEEKSVDEIAFRGMIGFYQKKNDKALEYLKQATEINAAHIMANNGLSRVYAATGKDDEARAALERVRSAFEEITAKERAQTALVDQVYRLQESYKKKNFAEVIVIGEQLESKVSPQQKKVVYEYLFNSYRALGRNAEADEIKKRAQSLK